ncbi:hypothetical protein Lp19_1231 [Lactiplantibacillus plantarum]|uniref:Uncharacterized protein n=1 Tax=Lactiplantibacillus plantarum TaxID=1590 RepID=A0A162GJ84_LACPN|nr:hypothetical protein [Lactiplantibacillus plantarum]KZU95952.1 hypothetical protein Lp19_1231 [Lactiplantibacillus plantarum]
MKFFLGGFALVTALIALSGVLFTALLGALVTLYNKKREISFQRSANESVKDEWVDCLTAITEKPELKRTDILAIRRSLRLFPYDEKNLKVSLYKHVYNFSMITEETEVKSFKYIEADLYHLTISLFIKFVESIDKVFARSNSWTVLEEDDADILRLIARWQISNRWINAKEVNGTSKSYIKRIGFDLKVLEKVSDRNFVSCERFFLDTEIIKAINNEINGEVVSNDQKSKLNEEYKINFNDVIEKESRVESTSWQIAKKIPYFLFSLVCAIGSFFVIQAIEILIANQVIDRFYGNKSIIYLVPFGLSIIIVAYILKNIITLPETISYKKLTKICVLSSLFLFLGFLITSTDIPSVNYHFKECTGLYFSAILLSLAVLVFTFNPSESWIRSLSSKLKKFVFKIKNFNVKL